MEDNVRVDSNERGSPALAIWNAIACVPVMLASARVLLLMVQSTAKQRERGGSYFFKISFSPPQLVNAADCAEGARLLAGTPGGNGNGAINGKSRTEL